MRAIRFLLLFVISIISLAVQNAAAVEIFVAPNGDDANPGTEGHPLATLEAARDLLRSARSARNADAELATVWVRGGVYRLDKTLKLEEADSGSASGKVVWRRWGDKPVRLIGGILIPPSACQKATDDSLVSAIPLPARNHIVAVDLKALGATSIGDPPERFLSGGQMPEVFFDGKPMQIARWPNTGWATFTRDDVVASGRGSLDRTKGERAHGERPGTFRYSGDHPSRWKLDRGAWLYGFWCHDWSSECLKIASIDADKHQITFAAPHRYGIGPTASWVKAPRRFYAWNVLEELDSPGEWYLDRETMKLYFWPPSDPKGKELAVSLLRDPMLQMTKTENVMIRDFIFEFSAGPGVIIKSGTANALAGCTIRNIAGTGASIQGGTGNTIRSCDLYNLGRAGIEISGGDRKTLTPGRNAAINNHIYNFARIQRTYAGGIGVHGVGNRVAHNRIHDTPHAGVFYGGNEHVLEYNEVFDLAKETSDVGAFYTGRDWGSRGNVLRYNYIHDLTDNPGCGVMGVYLDDCDSGDTLFGNVFYKAGRAAFIGGGRDNTVENNIMVDCKSAIHIDTRGLRRAKPGKGVKDGWDLLAKVEVFDYQKPPWSTRYPRLVNVMENDPLLPIGNVVGKNVAVDCAKWLNNSGNGGKYIRFEDNLVLDEGDPGFVNASTGDFALKPDSIIFKKLGGFKPIPFGKIGLFRDEYRTELSKP